RLSHFAVALLQTATGHSQYQAAHAYLVHGTTWPRQYLSRRRCHSTFFHETPPAFRDPPHSHWPDRNLPSARRLGAAQRLMRLRADEPCTEMALGQFRTRPRPPLPARWA